MAKLEEDDKKALDMLHRSMTFGLVMMGAIIYVLLSRSSRTHYDARSTFFIIASVLVLLGILLGNKIYSTNINHASTKKFGSYEEALANYRVSNLIKWALVEFASIASVILAFIDNNMMVFIPALMGAIYLYASRAKAGHFDGYRY